MLAELELRNFKCFRRHLIPFRATTIIVGRNNAGKSTITEALRLLAIVLNRFEYLPFKAVPRWLEAPKVEVGVSPSLDNQDFEFGNVFHRYGNPPAEIVAKFDNGISLRVYIGGEDRIHAVLKDSRRSVVTTKARARKLGLPRIGILPQIEPLRMAEQILQPDYVRRALDSTLASIHFRNQLNLLYAQHFGDFRDISESTWRGLQIRELRGEGQEPGTDLRLLVRNEDFVAEVGWMGHGLQMWLQIMWFLARSQKCGTVILDEPDVYMHADLQRKLIRLLRGRHSQVVIATHSIEIMAEVTADDILVVDRDRREAQFTSDVPAVQRVIDQIGGVHNLQLARLWNAKRCLFVEGEDIGVLKAVQDTLFPNSEDPLDVLPNMSVGGWGGWNYVIGSSLWVEGNVGRDIASYCLFDRDYHTKEQIEQRYCEAEQRGVRLHIWKRKELENYLLVPGAIRRIIASRIGANGMVPSEEEVARTIFALAGELEDEVMDGYIAEFYAQDRTGGPAQASKAARAHMTSVWGDFAGRLSVVSGKKLLARVSDWSQREFGVSLSAVRVARKLRPREIEKELELVLLAIETNQPFDFGQPSLVAVAHSSS